MLFQHRSTEKEIEMLSVITLVMWVCCVTVGAIGMLVRYPWPHAPPPEAPPVQARIMHVELTDAKEESETSEQNAPSSPEDSVPQPPPEQAINAPPAAPMVAVAAPSPSIAFPLPVDGATNIVDAKQAVPKGPATEPATQASAVTPVTTPIVTRKLTFGQGEARQPSPEYPREAVMARQEGTVIVRFTVGEDGRVQTAQAVVPSPFPLLNQAAVRGVRETWRFAPGKPRTFEVSIEYTLKRR